MIGRAMPKPLASSVRSSTHGVGRFRLAFSTVDGLQPPPERENLHLEASSYVGVASSEMNLVRQLRGLA
jgi:hypothetical protein